MVSVSAIECLYEGRQTQQRGKMNADRIGMERRMVIKYVVYSSISEVSSDGIR